MKKSLVFVALLAAFVGCKKDEVAAPILDEIRLASVVENVKTVNTAVQGTALVNGAAVGVSIVDLATPETVASAAYSSAHANLRYTADATGGLTTPETQIWPVDGSNVDIIAYAPYTAGAYETVAFSVKADQKADADYAASDLLYASRKDVAKTKETVALVFEHKLAKVNVILQPTSNLPADQIVGAKVTLLGVQTDVVMNLADGTVSAPQVPATADVVMAQVTGTDALESSVIVAPQTVAAGSELIDVVLASGKAFKFAVPSDIVMAAGKKTTLKVTLSNTKLTIASSITDWGTGTTATLIEADEYEAPEPEVDPDIAPPTFEGEHAYVDLGLPSGTKWATMNIGASSPEKAGSAFAWGETAPKSSYTKYNYAHWTGHVVTLPEGGTYDEDSWANIGTDIAGTQYDAATVNWGGSWTMPTTAQVQELYDNCSRKMSSINGVSCILLISKTTGNYVVIPFNEYLWTSNISGTSNANRFWFHKVSQTSYNFYNSSSEPKYQGFHIRPVCK